MDMDFQKESLINSFTQRDKDALVDLIMPFKDNLDNTNLRPCDLSWDAIRECFNSQTTEPKTVKEIRDLYEILKNEAKLYQSTEKKSVYKTGGGKALSTEQHTPGQDKIKGFIGDRMEPLENHFDSDTTYCELTNCCQGNNKETMAKSPDNVDILETEVVQCSQDSFVSTTFDSPSLFEPKVIIVNSPNITGQQSISDSKLKHKASSQPNSSNPKRNKSNVPVVNTDVNVYGHLNELVEKRSSIKDIYAEYKKELHDLHIKTANVALETALIEKKVAETKLSSSISEKTQNLYKEEILKAELKLLLEKQTI